MEKTCTVCNETKNCQNGFNKRGLSRDGFRSECKMCQKRASSKYYERNKESIDNKNSEWYYENRETRLDSIKKYDDSRKEVKKEYRIQNRDRIIEYLNNWKKLNPEYAKEWTDDNRDKTSFYCSLRRATIQNATPQWANLENIFKIYKKAQLMSKEEDIRYEVDHIIPLQNKLVCGLHVENNLQILSRSENAKKNNKFEPIIEHFE